ncbi:lipolysis-stimulated lipoprotein receptor isoform X2 [Cygnus olor]|uniref:lipolysis-stimulated lipoprotein receptor isoform X2 n=1 Tax=Cygnus olor TaxID=8869 RepID=UPI001ADDF8DC|nr:lipolysis-stimulated lipoprotein receptor isoform X2 [Cygnus olor]
MAAAAAALPALLALLGAARLPGPAAGMQVWVSNPSTVALLFQPVVLRCSYQSTASTPPIVTWKYKSFCSPRLGLGGGSATPQDPNSATSDSATACPDAARTVRIVATKQGNAVTLGDFYQGRSVTITDGAELSLGPAAWGDSGVYVCTVTSAQDLEGNNEAVAELVVLDWLFVVLVALGAALVALVLGLCWCQCCPHTCCCYVRCPCCPQRCCCPEALYLAGKAATSGAGSVYGGLYAPPKGPAPAAIALGPIGNGYSYSGASVSGHSSQVPLLRDTDSNLGSGPPAPPASMRVLRYLEDELNAFEPRGRYPPSGAGAPSDISSLHEAPDAWVPRGRPASPPRSRSPPRGRWHSVEDLGSSRGGSPPPSRPRSRSRDDLLGGAAPLPRLPPVGPPGPPRRLRKNDAMSRESLVV